ncbi:unnamed protein product [Calicophoron daubneyi]|uniref:Uncharacterized protein n=1 Tax=Calicophoron daubneyi TaxID=300641 RepID=A0AAV2TIU5_CALDB
MRERIRFCLIAVLFLALCYAQTNGTPTETTVGKSAITFSRKPYLMIDFTPDESNVENSSGWTKKLFKLLGGFSFRFTRSNGRKHSLPKFELNLEAFPLNRAPLIDKMIRILTRLPDGGQPMEWDERLADARSELFNTTLRDVCGFFYNVMENSGDPSLADCDCQLSRFTKGSVISDVTLFFQGLTEDISAIQLAEFIAEGARQLISNDPNVNPIAVGFSLSGALTVSLHGPEESFENTTAAADNTTACSSTTVAPTSTALTVTSNEMKTSVPATLAPVTTNKPEQKIIREVSIKMLSTVAMNGKPLEWDENLTNPDSELYKKAKEGVCANLLKATAKLPHNHGFKCKIKGFRKGSVVVEVEMVSELDDNSTVMNSTNFMDSVIGAISNYTLEDNSTDPFSFDPSAEIIANVTEQEIIVNITDPTMSSVDYTSAQTTTELITSATNLTTISVTEIDAASLVHNVSSVDSRPHSGHFKIGLGVKSAERNEATTAECERTAI